MPVAVLPAPFGAIRIETDPNGTVVAVSPRRGSAVERIDFGFPRPVLDAFHAYLLDGTAHPDVPSAYPREGFTGAVLDAMRRIPAGQVMTYGELAEAAGSPGAARAVGTACASNPVAIVVPCHRVVAAGGGLGGYSGGGLEVKKWLLDHERAQWGKKNPKKAAQVGQSSYTRQAGLVRI